MVPRVSDIHFRNPGLEDGLYNIDPDGDGGNPPFEVYCDMTTDGGGWTMVAYHFDVNGTYLKPTFHALNIDSAPVTPTAGHQRAIDPVQLGISYTEIGF
jgi:hypothetical protein